MPSDYLTKQLIAYIGNKRSLLPFLARVFADLRNGKDNPVFLDPFCGSGSVSRLAKSLGFRTKANDWEPYAQTVTAAHVGINKNELDHLFLERGGVREIFHELNCLGRTAFEGGYISRNYAPAYTEKADYRYERLFYTTENARFIDAVRDRIESWYPPGILDEAAQKEKNLLLSSLLYEAATHANTSGVFKAFHKGFGGHGKDALFRIMHNMHLEIPVLIDMPFPCTVSCLAAHQFVKEETGDICYLDPPYNGHQYGSNYFMLNTIVFWDKPPVSEERTRDGGFLEKAGIRKDWAQRKSDFCSAEKAPDVFSNLLDRIDARYIVVSYNTEGVIPLHDLCDLLSSQGSLSIQSENYVKYRGGRQSINRSTHNMEFLLVCERGALPAPGERAKIDRYFAERRLVSLLRHSYSPKRITMEFSCEDAGVLLFEEGPARISLPMDYFFRFSAVPEPGFFHLLSNKDLLRLEGKLERACCLDRAEECSILLELLDMELPGKKQRELQKRLLRVMKKFAFRKYQQQFHEIFLQVKGRVDEDPDKYKKLKPGLMEMKRVAELRFNG